MHEQTLASTLWASCTTARVTWLSTGLTMRLCCQKSGTSRGWLGLSATSLPTRRCSISSGSGSVPQPLLAMAAFTKAWDEGRRCSGVNSGPEHLPQPFCLSRSLRLKIWQRARTAATSLKLSETTKLSTLGLQRSERLALPAPDRPAMPRHGGSHRATPQPLCAVFLFCSILTQEGGELDRWLPCAKSSTT